ncbi:MAG TPA: glycoside hydrolase family 27 protein [Tepidisphaeraceae bacterium]|nr:glycoside hydrolase family 27 protein [Tepidisphaeraceae bacterium]
MRSSFLGGTSRSLNPLGVCAVLLVVSAACGSSGTMGSTTGAGGSNPTGGATASGGAGATGGSSGGAGGTPASGGATGSGGASSGGAGGTGGSTGGTGTGGGGGKGGATGAGGTGGAAATGGATGSGGKAGTTGSGGTSATGGTAGAQAGSGGGGGGGSAGSNGILAGTPPMGWNSWNAFDCNINEAKIKAAADALVSSGMKDAGYQYVCVDDCWMNGRDASGNIRWDTTKFPSGMTALGSYIHDKGLKFGIYSAPNTGTCQGLYGNPSMPSVYVGSLNHEQQDAKSYASWGVDYLKYDDCGGPLSGFAPMRDALRAAGRPIVYSINPYNGNTCVPTGAHTSTCGLDLPGIANMWRVSADIKATWGDVTRIIDIDASLSPYAGAGHWNDPDMLEVGNSGISDTEGRAHFSMWAIFAAPLIAGNDLSSMSATSKATLTNTEVIAVDQDPLDQQGKLAATPGTNLQVWSKPLSGTNVRAVALLNRGTGTASITVQWSALGIPTGAATVRDLWSHTDLGSFSGSYTASSCSR